MSIKSDTKSTISRENKFTTGGMNIGGRVKTNTEFPGVPKGTEGLVVEDYGSGITVAWDLPDLPYPKNKTPDEVAKMFAIDPLCPLRDGFDKKTELHYLEVVDA